ncbi:hypothetical protein EHS25_005537 [Saitozyma podzolica]|uniref:Uncharacterized protein n=1 Tax=Saitozyma podzolica TaxID=1890683 RepID=A0A427XXT4_9TREE|nr:hypothetical protein EHS25_005537 [Saitozyma podzolica]
MTTLLYELAVDSWADTDSIDILSSTNSRIASFPLAFVERGGDNTWRYVLDVVNQLVYPIPDQPGVITNTKGEPVNLADAPLKGSYRYEQLGSTAEPAFSRGPEYFTRFRAPNPEGSFSTRSDSKRSSTNQVGSSRAAVLR